MWQETGVKYSASMSLRRDRRTRRREILRKIKNFLWWLKCFELEEIGNLLLLQIEPSRRLRQIDFQLEMRGCSWRSIITVVPPSAPQVPANWRHKPQAGSNDQRGEPSALRASFMGPLPSLITDSSVAFTCWEEAPSWTDTFVSNADLYVPEYTLFISSYNSVISTVRIGHTVLILCQTGTATGFSPGTSVSSVDITPPVPHIHVSYTTIAGIAADVVK